jgi:hypothetical protein
MAKTPTQLAEQATEAQLDKLQRYRRAYFHAAMNLEHALVKVGATGVQKLTDKQLADLATKVLHARGRTT